MSAEFCLHFAATCLSYFLKVTAAFLAGLAIESTSGQAPPSVCRLDDFPGRLSGILAGIGNRRDPQRSS